MTLYRVQLYDKLEQEFITLPKFYRGVDKSLDRPGWKQATAREDFDFHISSL
jgi:hypothetical protein